MSATTADRCVYLFFRPDYTPAYVGMGRRQVRYTRHISGSHNPHLANIISNASKPLPFIVVADGLTREIASALEVALIKSIGREDLGLGPLVNRTNGGDGVAGRSGWFHQDETKEKIRVAHIGKRHSPQTIEKMRRAHFGKSIVKLRGRKQDPDVVSRRASRRRGQHWWHTPDGQNYLAHAARNDTDSLGRVTFFWTGLYWWSTPDGAEYKSKEPRNPDDVHGRITRRNQTLNKERV